MIKLSKRVDSSSILEPLSHAVALDSVSESLNCSVKLSLSSRTDARSTSSPRTSRFPIDYQIAVCRSRRQPPTIPDTKEPVKPINTKYSRSRGRSFLPSNFTSRPETPYHAYG